MRKLIAGALAGAMLAGCGSGLGGPSDRNALVASCVADGESEATCGCIADAMKSNLSPELFKKTADAVGRNGQNMMAYLDELTPQEAMAFASVTGDMLNCSLAADPATP